MNENELIKGRPYGGLAILYKKCWNRYIKPVKLSSKRLMAVTFTSDNVKLILINAYMPVDNYSKTTVTEEFQVV